MLHTKFHGNRPAGSGEDSLRVFTIYGHGSHLGHVTSIILMNFHFHVPKILLKMSQWFQRKASFNHQM